MKTTKYSYQAPMVELTTVTVESGIAQSLEGNDPTANSMLYLFFDEE